MDGYVVVHSHTGQFVALEPRGTRLTQKVVWIDMKADALQFARERDAQAFGDTFAPGAFRVMPVLPKPAAEFRVMPDKKIPAYTEGEVISVARPKRRKP